jgi:serine/threonine-protein kinase
VTKEAQLSAKGDGLLGHEIGGRYGVIERLGMGGMGAVYKAIDPKRDLTVAIKVLREAYAQHPAIRERFIREAEAGASLSHENVVPLIDFGIENSGRLWLAMEFAEGWTLRDEINHNGAFTVREAVELMRQVLRGLAVAHDAGLIHRDLKHDNIMYHGRRERFIAKIVDFGVVKSEAADLDRRSESGWKPPQRSKSPQRDAQGAFDLSAALKAAEQADGKGDQADITPATDPASSEDESLKNKALTAVGMMVGSPSYMAPEQIRGLKVGPPADLYALAVVAYEILAARRLFTVNDYETLLREDAKRDAPRLVFSARGEVIPEALADIIHTALAHDPTDRYQDAHTMLLALDQMNFKSAELPLDLFCVLPEFVESEDISKPKVATNEASDTVESEGNAGDQSDLEVRRDSMGGVLDVQGLSQGERPTEDGKVAEITHSTLAGKLWPSVILPPLIVLLVVWLFASIY